MKRNLLAYFLAISLVVGPTAASAATPSSNGPTRYFLSTTKSFWRNAFGVRHVFSDGFTTNLNDIQVRLARFAGLKPVAVKKFNILADQASPSPDASSSPSPEPISPIGWGVKYMIGRSHQKTGDGITVAVLDTGVDIGHPDLKARIAECKDFTDSSGPVVDESCPDNNGHGTHVAGILAADGGSSGSGMIGMAPKAKILAYKVCDDSGLCYSDDIASAMNAAVDAGAQIMVLGFGGEQQSSFLDDAISYATDKDVLMVAAAGNDGPYDDSVDWPAHDSRIISVGAMAGDGSIADFSSRGNNENTKAYRSDDGDLEMVAPGVNIESTFTGGGYAILSGTSMAAPHIAGLAALIWQSKADNPAKATRLLLHELANDILPVGDDNASGWGIPVLK